MAINPLHNANYRRPWPRNDEILMNGTIAREFGGTNRKPDAASEYYNGTSKIPNTGRWRAMALNPLINGRIPSITGQEWRFSDFNGATRYRSITLTGEPSSMQRYRTNLGTHYNMFAPNNGSYGGDVEDTFEHIGSFQRYYSLMVRGDGRLIRVRISDILGQLGWPRYIRIRLNNTVTVRTRGDQKERKGADRYTEVKNAGFSLWAGGASVKWYAWRYAGSPWITAQRSNFRVGAGWERIMMITSFALSTNDDRYGEGTLTDSGGTGGTGGGGGGGGYLGNGGGGSTGSGSGVRIPSNSDHYHDMYRLYNNGARYLYIFFTAEVNKKQRSGDATYNYVLVTAPQLIFET